MTTAGGDEQDHVRALDGLRGIAVALVFLVHLFHPPMTSKLGVLAQHVAYGGWMGVDLFFVLSGFLITRILLRAKGRAGYFTSFYGRRVLRIFPVYYGVLLLLFVVLPALSARWRAMIDASVDGPVYLFTYTANLVRPFHPLRSVGVIHFWSLMVEEHFYFVWPLLVSACSRRALTRVAIGAFVFAFAVRLALLAHGVEPQYVYEMTPARIDGLAAGALIAILAEEKRLGAQARRAAAIVIAIAIPTLFAVAVRDEGFFHYGWAMVRVGFFVVAALWGAVLVRVLLAPEGSPVRAALESRGARWLGKYSYGAYVFHIPLQDFVLAPLGVRAVLDARVGTMLGAVAYLLVAVAITYALAYASYEAFEKRFLALKRYFPYGAPARIDYPRAAATASSSENTPS